ncbi:MAG: hypothetical protein FVQ84_17105 [Planctomycetes bacterium]|nr:hypothetical protein [Planctomycetota bacterium]
MFEKILSENNDMGHLGQQLSNEQWKEFCHCVRKSGISTDPWWEAIVYTDSTKVMHLELFVKRGLFSKRQIAVGNDYENLETMAYYIKNNPECRDWQISIKTGNWNLKSGQFTIVEKSAFRGGDKQLVVNLLRKFGVNQEVIDDTLDEKNEKVLGYILSPNAEDAKELSRIIEVGATRPDIEGTKVFVSAIKEYAKKLHGR